MKCRLLQLLCYCALTGILRAQPLEESFFSRIQGLQSNVVYCITQDQSGYIWLGTNRGAIRYDGFEFTHFTTADGLSDNEVFQIREDQKRRVWFLTHNGRLSFYEKGKIHHAGNAPFLQSISAGSMSAGFWQQGDSICYITRRKAYLFVGSQLRNVWTAKELFPNPDASFAEVIYQEGPLRLISNQGFYLPSGNTKVLFSTSQKVRPITKVISLRSMLCYYSGNSLFRYSFGDGQTQMAATPQGEPINAWHYDAADSAILLITPTRLCQFSLKTHSFREILRDSIAFSCYIYKDALQNLWVGSQTEGLWLRRNLSYHLYQPTTALRSREAYSLGQLHGRIYAGYLNNEYFEWAHNKAYWKKAVPATGLNKSYGFSLINNKLYSLSGNNITDVAGNIGHFFPGSVKAMASNAKEAAVALSYNVIALPLSSLFDGEKIWADSPVPTREIFDKRAYCLWQMADTIWIGSDEGLHYYSGKDKARRVADSLPALQRKIIRIADDRQRRLWLATAGDGLAVRLADKWVPIHAANGLASNNCTGLFVGSDSTIWVSTDRGITRITPTWENDIWRPRVQNFYSNDGLPPGTINDILVQQDTVWLATSEGVAYLLEKDLVKTTHPSVLIQKVYINGVERPVDGPLRLTHRENNLRIEFTIAQFMQSLPPYFAYQLEGADTAWSFTNNRQIEYAQLPPGEYRFLVTADSPFRSEVRVTALPIFVSNVFWKRPWFIFFSVLLSIAAAGLLIRWRIRHLRRTHSMEQTTLRLSKEKAELEQKAAAMQMNPHFLFNALNAIKGYYGSGNREDGDNYTSQLAGLMRLILEKNAQPLISLRDELNMLQRYLNLASLQTAGKFSYKITVSETVTDPEKIHFPPMLIQPFVENAIVHGLGPREREGHVEINMNFDQQLLTCQIRDNGVGLQRSAVINKYRIHQSKGITITRQRLALYSDRAGLDIRETIDAEGRVSGTEVLIYIPVTS